MGFLDYLIFVLYMAGVLAIGLYHFRRNKNAEDYYVGSRSIKAHHVGLSIVATDVGGGFSIGLGGVGFLMGLSGSWLLFTGLVGAWLTAVLIIPRIKKIDAEQKFMTYPDFLRYRYNGTVALLAAVISCIGYLGFTGAQMLAGAKLASATILQSNPFGMEPVTFALLAIAVITILYTVVGGLKAVIYTDTIQWALLLCGLLFVTIPVTLYKIGGLSALRESLPPEFFSLTNITAVQFINWMITIIPIWLIGMTLYQRMYACRDEKQARRAWYIAGLFEYPVMAFTGVFLGMCARVIFPGAESEMAMPMLIRDVLPVGITGIVIASYFSAIMSTADSCLMASSGNLVNDIVEKYIAKSLSAKTSIRLSMAATFVIGILAVMLAARFGTVLNAILYAYAFMVSGLFIPTLGAYFWKRSSPAGAVAGMLSGGGLTLLLMTNVLTLPPALDVIGLDVTVYGILTSAVLFTVFSVLMPDRETDPEKRISPPKLQNASYDTIETLDGAMIQHGPLNKRIYVMKLGAAEPGTLLPRLDAMASQNGYTKIFAKVPRTCVDAFKQHGYKKEAQVPGFFNGTQWACFMAKYFCPRRKIASDAGRLDEVMKITIQKCSSRPELGAGRTLLRPCAEEDVEQMIAVYKKVFPSYPFPIHDPDYLLETMNSHVAYFAVEEDGRIVALSSAEMDTHAGNAEMTDFATLPEMRGNNYAIHLLEYMEARMRDRGMKTAYTIARAASPGMNITFARAGYAYGGRLINNTNISGKIESMNVWYKLLDASAAPSTS